MTVLLEGQAKTWCSEKERNLRTAGIACDFPAAPQEIVDDIKATLNAQNLGTRAMITMLPSAGSSTAVNGWTQQLQERFETDKRNGLPADKVYRLDLDRQTRHKGQASWNNIVFFDPSGLTQGTHIEGFSDYLALRTIRRPLERPSHCRHKTADGFKAVEMLLYGAPFISCSLGNQHHSSAAFNNKPSGGFFLSIPSENIIAAQPGNLSTPTAQQFLKLPTGWKKVEGYKHLIGLSPPQVLLQNRSHSANVVNEIWVAPVTAKKSAVTITGVWISGSADDLCQLDSEKPETFPKEQRIFLGIAKANNLPLLTLCDTSDRET